MRYILNKAVNLNYYLSYGSIQMNIARNAVVWI